jgi:hypothetical protein
MFLLFSQQFFKYKWTGQSDAITHDEGPYPLSEMTVPDMCLFVEQKYVMNDAVSFITSVTRNRSDLMAIVQKVRNIHILTSMHYTTKVA